MSIPKIVRIIAICWAALLPGAGVQAATTCERWCGDQPRAAHAGTLEIEKQGEQVRLRFDLSALPRGATVHAAWLRLKTDRAQPYDPILVHAAGADRAQTIQPDGEPLALEPPWYRRFVATQVVRRWASSPESNQGFVVQAFEGFRPEGSALDILYDGEAQSLPPQVTGLRAVHHHGQTFLAWSEHPSYRPRPDEVRWVARFSEKGDAYAEGPGEGAFGMPNHPGITLRALRRLQGLGLRDQPSGFQGIRPLWRVAEVEPVAYRVYCHQRPITPQNIHQAELLAEVEPLSGLDTEVYQIHFKGEFLDQWEEPESFIPTYCVAKGRAIKPGEALYVHTPGQDGQSYYAVTAVLGGTENLVQFGPGNALAEPVAEQVTPVQPVLQWVQEDRYRTDPIEYWYRIWAAPPLVNLPSRSFRIGVAVSENFVGPGPLVISSISGTFNVREAIRVPKPDRVTLTIQRQLDWLPALFYNEGRGTLRAATQCRVDYFSERYMHAIIRWIMDRYRIDRSKIEGSLLYFGLRHPEIFPKMSFGTYTATYDYRWAPGSPAHLGPKGIKTVDGEDAWEMYSVGGYVLKYPGRDIPFLICISGTGKDRGHTSEFGWQDDPRGWAALQQARQPFVAAWSMRLPEEVSRGLSLIDWDQSIPAFSRCSLDNNPGNGDPADGDYYGQINGYLLWDCKTIVDEPGRWEMTVYVTSDCPLAEAAADVTPRHCRNFRPRPGQRFAWEVSAVESGRRIASGRLVADSAGLVTVPTVPLHKKPRRIAIVAR